jgi:hypothetical protein
MVHNVISAGLPEVFLQIELEFAKIWLAPVNFQ